MGGRADSDGFLSGAVRGWARATAALRLEPSPQSCHIWLQIESQNMEAILSNASVSITELKRNPSAVIEAADGESVAVLVHNKPSAYLVPAETYQRLMERLEDLELAELVRARRSERRVKVKLDDL